MFSVSYDIIYWCISVSANLDRTFLTQLLQIANDKIYLPKNLTQQLACYLT